MLRLPHRVLALPPALYPLTTQLTLVGSHMPSMTIFERHPRQSHGVSSAHWCCGAEVLTLRRDKLRLDRTQAITDRWIMFARHRVCGQGSRVQWRGEDACGVGPRLPAVGDLPAFVARRLSSHACPGPPQGVPGSSGFCSRPLASLAERLLPQDTGDRPEAWPTRGVRYRGKAPCSHHEHGLLRCAAGRPQNIMLDPWPCSASPLRAEARWVPRRRPLSHATRSPGCW